MKHKSFRTFTLVARDTLAIMLLCLHYCCGVMQIGMSECLTNIIPTVSCELLKSIQCEKMNISSERIKVKVRCNG